MPELDADDYERILRLIGAVAELESPDDFAEVVADEVGAAVDSDVTTLNDIDPSSGTIRYVVSPRSYRFAPEVIDALAELAGQHPLISHMSITGDGSAIRISDFWTPQQWHSSELYARVYRPLGVEHQLAISLPTAQPAVVGLALNRGGSLDFSERDRAVLDRARPFLAQSWRRAMEHARVLALLTTTSEVLSERDASVLLLTDPVHELTPGALTELYRFYGRPSERGPLPARVADWIDQQRRRSDELGELSRPLSTTRGGRRMILRFLAATTRHPDALLLRITPEPELPHELAALGLTARETEILDALIGGASNAVIAQRMHVSPATVKNHLEHVYRKLGAHNRVQATTIALSMLSRTPGPSAP